MSWIQFTSVACSLYIALYGLIKSHKAHHYVLIVMFLGVVEMAIGQFFFILEPSNIYYAYQSFGESFITTTLFLRLIFIFFLGMEKKYNYVLVLFLGATVAVLVAFLRFLYGPQSWLGFLMCDIPTGVSLLIFTFLYIKKSAVSAKEYFLPVFFMLVAYMLWLINWFFYENVWLQSSWIVLVSLYFYFMLLSVMIPRHSNSLKNDMKSFEMDQ